MALNPIVFSHKVGETPSLHDSINAMFNAWSQDLWTGFDEDVHEVMATVIERDGVVHNVVYVVEK